jgi:hypothetical protein
MSDEAATDARCPLGQRISGRLVGRRFGGRENGSTLRGHIVAAPALEAMVLRQLDGRLVGAARLRLSEGIYLLPPLGELMRLLAASRRERTEWLEDRAECDDFAYALRSEAGAHGFAVGEMRVSLCLGLAWGGFDWIDGAHAVNWFVADDGELRFVEPRHDDIYERDHCRGQIEYMFA